MSAWLDRYITWESSALYECVHEAYGMRFVTNGNGLLVIDDDEARVGPPPNLFLGSKSLESYGALCRALTIGVPESAKRGNLLDLWAWLDGFDFNLCDSSYCIEYKSLCPNCDGKGWYHALDPEPVLICGQPINRNVVSWWLPTELLDVANGDGSFRYWDWLSNDVECVSFVGRGWRATIACLLRNVWGGRYREYVLGCGPLWMNRNDIGARAAYVDWVQEQGYDELAAFGQSEVSHETLATH